MNNASAVTIRTEEKPELFRCPLCGRPANRVCVVTLSSGDALYITCRQGHKTNARKTGNLFPCKAV